MNERLYVWVMLHHWHNIIHTIEVLCPHQQWQCEALHMAWDRAVDFVVQEWS